MAAEAESAKAVVPPVDYELLLVKACLLYTMTIFRYFCGFQNHQIKRLTSTMANKNRLPATNTPLEKPEAVATQLLSQIGENFKYYNGILWVAKVN